MHEAWGSREIILTQCIHKTDLKILIGGKFRNTACLCCCDIVRDGLLQLLYRCSDTNTLSPVQPMVVKMTTEE